jgi:hypothetical protein
MKLKEFQFYDKNQTCKFDGYFNEAEQPEFGRINFEGKGLMKLFSKSFYQGQLKNYVPHGAGIY